MKAWANGGQDRSGQLRRPPFRPGVRQSGDPAGAVFSSKKSKRHSVEIILLETAYPMSGAISQDYLGDSSAFCEREANGGFTAKMSTALKSESGEFNIGADLYLDMVKKSLADALHDGGYYWPLPRPKSLVKRAVFDLLVARGIRPVRVLDPSIREEGTERPPNGPAWLEVTSAHTLLGLKRLNNLQRRIEDVLKRCVPGDLIETGVWRGGACIFMRAILKARGVRDRKVWAADSFEGLPVPDPARYPFDRGSTFHEERGFAVSLEEVRRNFEKYGLLDDQVEFVKGWFRETLPKLVDHKWEVIHLDGDMYQSTFEALVSFYPGLSPGGYHH